MKKWMGLFLITLMLSCAYAEAAEKVDKATVTFPETYYAMHAYSELAYASPFSEGLAAVSIDGKIGFINDSGMLVIPATWENAEPFRDGLSLVKGEYGYGFINRKGEIIIAPIWAEFEYPSGCQGDPANYFYNGITWVRDHDGYWGLINNKGKLLLSPQLTRGDRSREWTSPFFGANERAATIAFDYDTYTWHAINKDGKPAGLYSQLMSLMYFNVDAYETGYSKHNVFRNGETLFLADGTIVTQQEVDSDSALFTRNKNMWTEDTITIGGWEDAFPVLPGRKVYFAWKAGAEGRSLIDADGIPLCSDTFDAIGGVYLIDGDHLIACSQQGNCYRIDANGKIKQVDSYKIPIMNGLLMHDHVQGLCKDGKPISGLAKDISYVGLVNNRLLLICSNEDGTYGLVNSQGTLISNPYWDEIVPFDEDTVLVRKDDCYGLLNTIGQTILKTEYEQIVAVSQGIVLAYKNGQYTFFDVSTTQRIGTRNWEYSEPFSSGMAYVTWVENEMLQRGFINTSGRIVVVLSEDVNPKDASFVYHDDMLLCAHYGLCYLDRNGNLLTKIPWDDATNFNGDRAIAWRNGEWFIINRQGEIIY